MNRDTIPYLITCTHKDDDDDGSLHMNPHKQHRKKMTHSVNSNNNNNYNECYVPPPQQQQQHYVLYDSSESIPQGRSMTILPHDHQQRRLLSACHPFVQQQPKGPTTAAATTTTTIMSTTSTTPTNNIKNRIEEAADVDTNTTVRHTPDSSTTSSIDDNEVDDDDVNVPATTLSNTWNSSSSSRTTSGSPPVLVKFPIMDPEYEHLQRQSRCTIVLPGNCNMDENSNKNDQVILDRIQTLLKQLSTTFTVEANPTQFELSCRSILSRFSIFLWQSSSQESDENDNKNSTINIERQMNEKEVSSSNKNQNNGGSIIVEIQRRYGCPIEMQYIRRALFVGLQQRETRGVVVSAKEQLMIPLQFCRNVFAKYCTMEKQQKSTPPTIVLEMDVSKCMELLSSSYVDSQKLGLESLADITSQQIPILDGGDVSSSIQQQLASELFHPENDNDNASSSTRTSPNTQSQPQQSYSYKLRQHLLPFLHQPLNHRHRKRSPSSSNRSIFDSTTLYDDELHFLALKVICNLLQRTIDTPTELPPNCDSGGGLLAARTAAATYFASLDVSKDVFWHTTLHGCRINIVHAIEKPCIATISTDLLLHVLQILQHASESKSSLSSDIAPKLCKEDNNNEIECSTLFVATNGLLMDLVEAHSIGMSRHVRLEEKSRDLIDYIQAQ